MAYARIESLDYEGWKQTAWLLAHIVTQFTGEPADFAHFDRYPDPGEDDQPPANPFAAAEAFFRSKSRPTSDRTHTDP